MREKKNKKLLKKTYKIIKKNYQNLIVKIYFSMQCYIRISGKKISFYLVRLLSIIYGEVDHPFPFLFPNKYYVPQTVDYSIDMDE